MSLPVRLGFTLTVRTVPTTSLRCQSTHRSEMPRAWPNLASASRSWLILFVISEENVRGLLTDVVTAHNEAASGSLKPEQHQAVVEIVQRILAGKKWRALSLIHISVLTTRPQSATEQRGCNCVPPTAGTAKKPADR